VPLLFQESKDGNIDPSTSKKKARNILEAAAKVILNKWYDAALGYPLPNPKEMQELIAATGLTRPVIVKYFANRRLRNGKS